MTPIAHLAGLTSLALLCMPAFSAEDYAKLKVVDATEMAMRAGPGYTAVLLSRDGTRALQIDGTTFCLLAPAEIGPWAQLSCTEVSRDMLSGGVEDMLWSPDGTQLLAPTYAVGLERFEDTDIEVIDPQTLAVTNLTDDGASGSLIRLHTAANMDVVPQWLDNDTIAFIRYAIPAEGISKRSDASLMVVTTTSGKAAPVSKPLSELGSSVYTLAAAPDGKHLAYALDSRTDPDAAGIYLTDVEGALHHRLVAVSALPRAPEGLAFSADGKYLLSLSGSPERTGVGADIVDVSSGAVIPVGDGLPITGVAWSPTGSALAYLVYDRSKPTNPGGLFIANAPGAPGRLLVGGAFMPPVCCGKRPFTWTANDTMLLSRIDVGGTKVLYVRLGE